MTPIDLVPVLGNASLWELDWLIGLAKQERERRHAIENVSEADVHDWAVRLADKLSHGDRYSAHMPNRRTAMLVAETLAPQLRERVTFVFGDDYGAWFSDDSVEKSRTSSLNGKDLVTRGGHALMDSASAQRLLDEKDNMERERNAAWADNRRLRVIVDTL